MFFFTYTFLYNVSFLHQRLKKTSSTNIDNDFENFEASQGQDEDFQWTSRNKRSSYSTKINNVSDISCATLNNEYNIFKVFNQNDIDLVLWLQKEKLLASNYECEHCHQACYMVKKSLRQTIQMPKRKKSQQIFICVFVLVQSQSWDKRYVVVHAVIWIINHWTNVSKDLPLARQTLV